MTSFESSLHRLETFSKYNFTSDQRLEGIRAKLDANENWHMSERKLNALMSKAIELIDAREYPLGVVEELCSALATHLHISPESIIPTQGADQAIDLLCQTFLRQDHQALIVTPTYSFYELRTAIANAQTIEVSMNKDLSLPVDTILSKGKDAAIIFLCSPNNPTGNQFSAADIIRICDNFPGLVVLDEAYVEYARENLVREVAHRRNLAVLRTFSKAFGLANLRLGFIIANPEWAPSFLDRVQYPYPVSSLVAAIAIQLLKQFQLVEDAVKATRRERALLLEGLRKIRGITALDSQSNFILANLPLNAGKAHKQLLERGIATKKIGQILDLPNCIRVTVGTHEMNSILLESLNEMLSHA